MTEKKKLGINLAFWAIVFFLICVGINYGCGASFPNQKPVMTFENCQIINTDSETGEMRLQCHQDDSFASEDSAKDATIDNSRPEENENE
jgi:hypothetical protein